MLNYFLTGVRALLVVLASALLQPLMSADPAPAQNAAQSADKNSSKKCLYISSYHKGYAWSDEIEEHIHQTLAGACELRQIDMDTKRRKLPEEIFAAKNHAIKFIEDWQPDVVITSDDNAAKHLIAPHYRDANIPFVFCGINWTVEEYGFPYSNVTGMVEVAPSRTMLESAFKLSGYGRKALYISEDTLSGKKNFDRVNREAAEFNIQIDAVYASHFQQWTSALEAADNYDFIVIGSNAAIDAWDKDRAIAAMTEANKLSVTNEKWMMPYAAFGFTKLASEQGEWAAQVAVQILNGTRPAEIPLASNKKWDLWLNESLFEKLDIAPNPTLMKKAKRFEATPARILSQQELP